MITAPVNFGLVSPGVYRSGFPSRHNLGFLQRLGLRTIVTLEEMAHPADVQAWIDTHGIVVKRYITIASKEPFHVADPVAIRRAIRTLLDPSAHPVMVHSMRGESRCGVVIGCLRKLQRWSLAATFDEYRRYAGPTAQQLDLQMIELTDVSSTVGEDGEVDELEDEVAALEAVAVPPIAVEESMHRSASMERMAAADTSPHELQHLP